MENQPNLELNEQAVDALRVSAKWSMFLAIMGFIGIAFMLVAAVFMGSVMSMLPADNSSPIGAMRGFLSLFYVILAALYFPPIYYLLKYASDMKNALVARNSIGVSNALVYLKSHHKYLAVSLIVLIALYILGIIGMVIFFASSAARL